MKSITGADLKAAQERGRARRRRNNKLNAAHARQARIEQIRKCKVVPTTFRCGHAKTEENTYKSGRVICCYQCKRASWVESRKDPRDCKPLLETLWKQPNA